MSQNSVELVKKKKSKDLELLQDLSTIDTNRLPFFVILIASSAFVSYTYITSDPNRKGTMKKLGRKVGSSVDKMSFGAASKGYNVSKTVAKTGINLGKTGINKTKEEIIKTKEDVKDRLHHAREFTEDLWHDSLEKGKHLKDTSKQVAKTIKNEGS